jgi:hypothetical protein
MDTILYHYNRAFPLKTVYLSNQKRSKWLTQGIRISSKKMWFLNGLKGHSNLSRETQEYISRYHIIYKRVTKEAKKRENDRYVLRAKHKTKAMWHIINKEVGKSLQFDQKIELSNGTETISDPQNVADMIHSFFVGIIDDLLNQNCYDINVQTAKQRINYCPNTIYLFPVTENEIKCVPKSL